MAINRNFIILKNDYLLHDLLLHFLVRLCLYLHLEPRLPIILNFHLLLPHYLHALLHFAALGYPDVIIPLPLLHFELLLLLPCVIVIITFTIAEI